MVLAWLPWPGQPPHRGAWLCADFRSTARDRPAAPWMLRLGVEAGTSDQVPAARARVTAHDLADLDDGYRLASLIDVDVASLDRHQLARLMLAALGHVQARLLRGAGGQAARPARKWTVAARTPAAS